MEPPRGEISREAIETRENGSSIQARTKPEESTQQRHRIREAHRRPQRATGEAAAKGRPGVHPQQRTRPGRPQAATEGRTEGRRPTGSAADTRPRIYGTATGGNLARSYRSTGKGRGILSQSEATERDAGSDTGREAHRQPGRAVGGDGAEGRPGVHPRQRTRPGRRRGPRSAPQRDTRREGTPARIEGRTAHRDQQRKGTKAAATDDNMQRIKPCIKHGERGCISLCKRGRRCFCT